MRCRACGAATRSAARFCDQCGARLEAAPSTRRTHDPEGGDRRIVTALFADLVDYVRLVAEYDAEEVRRRVDAALGSMVEAIEAFDGTREKFIGDAVFAVFGWPMGHDDDALRAAHCALAIRAALTNHQDPAGESLQVRIGLATGEVVAAPRGFEDALDWSLTGPAVTTAARIQALAAPGEILLDDATVRATRKRLRLEDLGAQVLRGQTRPVRIRRLIAEASFQPWRPPIGPLVGRRTERAALRRALAGVLEMGRGATVLVEGDAGMGKSRLMADLRADARAAGLAWTWVDNVSYGASEPYRFVRAFAQSVADEHGTDSGSFARRMLFTSDVSATDARRWAGGVAAIARAAAFSGWEAEAPLVPTDPAEIASSIADVAVRYTERLLEASGPRVLLVDDLHWLDASSAGVFGQLVGIAARLPLLLVVGTRPGIAAPWLDHPTVERITLDGLDRDETGELAVSVARAPVAVDDVDLLHARTGGNPLFIVETIRALLDEGDAFVEGRLAMPVDGHRRGVPTTLRALLGARIDALSDEARSIVRIASVIGMAFTEAGLLDVADHEVDPAALERLVESSLVVPLGSARGWRFRHPLIHDVAYAGLLASRRRHLHGRVADCLEQQAGGASLDLIARHRAAAGDAERAVPLLAAAADAAMAVGAAAEAAIYWQMAAELLGADPAAEPFRQRARDTLRAVITPGN